MGTRILVRQQGGPEVLEVIDDEPNEPGEGEVTIRNTAVGLNYIDTYHRSGLYPSPVGLPFTPGLEGAGVVEAVGAGVTDLKEGQRVAYGTGPLGAYSARRTMPATPLVPLPDGVADETGAAMMLKGMTVQYLIRQTYEVKRGETVLVHAAAGGIGLIICQWLNHLGVTVIGTVGSEEKAELAKRFGCHHTILYSKEDVPGKVKELTNGEGVPVVYDGVGKATFEMSLDSLRPLGLLASFGNASGAVEPFSLGMLAAKGSLFVTRPTLMTYTRTRDRLLAGARDLMQVVESGAVKIEINQRFPLDQARQAHEALEGRQTTGSTVMIP